MSASNSKVDNNKLLSCNNIICSRIYIDAAKNSDTTKKTIDLQKFSDSNQNKEKISNNSSTISFQNIPYGYQSYSQNYSNELFDSLIDKKNAKNKELSLYYKIGTYNKSYSSESNKQEANLFELPKISKKLFSLSNIKYSSSSSIKKLKKQYKSLNKSTKNVAGYIIGSFPKKIELNNNSINKLIEINKQYSNDNISKFTINYSKKDVNKNLVLNNHFLGKLSNIKLLSGTEMNKFGRNDDVFKQVKSNNLGPVKITDFHNCAFSSSILPKNIKIIYNDNL